MKRPVAIALLLAATGFWGVTFTVVKQAVTRVDVFVFLAQRFIPAFLLLTLIAFRQRRAPRPAEVGRGAILGLCLFLAYATQTVALRSTSASGTGFLTGLSVVLVPLLGALFFRERIGRGLRLAVALAVPGLFLLVTDGVWSFGAGGSLALASAVCIAFQMLLTGRYAPGNDIAWLTAVEIGVVALASWAAAVATGQAVWVWRPALLGTYAFLVLCATVFAFLAQTNAQRCLSATQTALILCLEPVFAAAWAHGALGERLGAAGYAGAALILAGMLFAELGGAGARMNRTA